MLFKKRSDQTDERYNYEKFINGCVPGGIVGAFIGLGILAIPGVNFTYARPHGSEITYPKAEILKVNEKRLKK